jgi:O-antigen/teichoic acid export membrane protein
LPIVYSTFLVLLTFAAGHFWRLRSMYVHEFRSYDLSFFSYACLAQRDSIYKQIAREYLRRSEHFRKIARSRNYSAACSIYSMIFCFIGWVFALFWSNCIALYWVLILPAFFLVMSYIIYCCRIGYKKSNPCLEIICRWIAFLWPSLQPHWEEIEDTIKQFRKSDTEDKVSH